MKKLVLSVFAVATMGFSFSAFAQYKDGEYTGQGQGKEGMIDVAVKVEGSKITNVEVTKHDDTEAIMMGVIDNLLPEIVEKQGTQGVDVITGATYSSTGIINAVNQALEKAK